MASPTTLTKKQGNLNHLKSMFRHLNSLLPPPPNKKKKKKNYKNYKLKKLLSTPPQLLPPSPLPPFRLERSPRKGCAASAESTVMPSRKKSLAVRKSSELRPSVGGRSCGSGSGRKHLGKNLEQPMKSYENL